MANYVTSDGGIINLCIVGRRAISGYLRTPGACRNWPDDPRFSDVMPLIQNASGDVQLIARPSAVSRSVLASTPQEPCRASGRRSEVWSSGHRRAGAGQRLWWSVESAVGGKAVQVVRGPVQFNHEPLKTTRPGFRTHRAGAHGARTGLGPHQSALKGSRRDRLTAMRRNCILYSRAAGNAHGCTLGSSFGIGVSHGTVPISSG